MGHLFHFGSCVREGLTAILSTSVTVKILCLSLVCLHVVTYFSSSIVTSLCVTPGYFWPPHFHIWTSITHCLIEIHWWEIVLDAAVILFVGKLLEPLWGAFEMVVFFAVVNVGTAILAAFFYYFLYMVTFNTELLFGVHIHGKVVVHMRRVIILYHVMFQDCRVFWRRWWWRSNK